MTKNSETQNVCKKCNGKRWYKYDDCHSKFCEYCCKHDQGYWLLPEGYTSAGNYCCNAGCGHTITPKEFKKVSNSTQNDEIEVDGETYVKWDTQNDWEKRFYDKFPCLMHFRPNKRSYGYSEVGDDVKEFIAKELADARREVYLEIEEKVMECKKDITKYQNTTDILHKTITKHEKAWINSGFRLALESLDKLQKFVVLATLRKEGV